MKRVALTIVVFVLLGAVVNVGVAWGCAVWIPATGPYIGEVRRASLLEVESDGTWLFWALDRFEQSGAVFYLSHWDTRSDRIDCGEITTQSTYLRPSELAPSWAGLRTPPATDDEIRDLHPYGWPDHQIRRVNAYGWPFISMWQDFVYTGGGYGSTLVRGLQLAFLPPDGGLARAVPLRPIWPGFAVNTLLYGTLFCLLICLAIAVRRFLRLRRGLCPKCAYPMGESAVCSECGNELPKQVGPAT